MMLLCHSQNKGFLGARPPWLCYHRADVDITLTLDITDLYLRFSPPPLPSPLSMHHDLQRPAPIITKPDSGCMDNRFSFHRPC
jgi:hypothetical protein